MGLLAAPKPMTPQALRLWRAEYGYSQKELAHAIGKAPLTVARWEQGIVPMPANLGLTLLGLLVTEIHAPLTPRHRKAALVRQMRQVALRDDGTGMERAS